MAASMRVIYLPGVAGFPKLSPALEGLGVDVVVPDLPGFNGAPGFESPPDYLGWLTAVWIGHALATRINRLRGT